MSAFTATPRHSSNWVWLCARLARKLSFIGFCRHLSIVSSTYLGWIKTFFRTKWIYLNIRCNLKSFLCAKCCNVTVRCDLKAFLQYDMWRMWSTSFTWLLMTWSIHMSADIGRCPLAQVLRNSLSGLPPPSGHATLQLYTRQPGRRISIA